MIARDHLGRVSRAYETKADEYMQVCDDLATAKAAFTKAKAVFKVNAKLNARPGEKVTDVDLETRAHADEVISALYTDFLRLEYAERAIASKLRQLKTQNDNGRTAVVDERNVDQIHAQGLSGAP